MTTNTRERLALAAVALFLLLVGLAVGLALAGPRAAADVPAPVTLPEAGSAAWLADAEAGAEAVR